MGNVYVADSSNFRIQKFDSNGNFIAKWGSWGSGDGQFKGNTGVAVDSSGDVYVADFFNHRIQKFDSSGNFITKWGSYGLEEGQFIRPMNIATDSSGNVYVTDSHSYPYDDPVEPEKWCRFQKFNSSGGFLMEWVLNDVRFYYPTGAAVDSLDNVYVVDTANNRIQKFDSTGNIITKWGHWASEDNYFSIPTGVAVDSSNNVYIADAYYSVQKFDSNGNFITALSGYGHINTLWVAVGLPTI